MKSLVKIFRNYLVANLCALVPLWCVAFGWMPDQVKVYLRETVASPVFIVADGSTLLGERYGSWADGRIWRFYLRKGMEWKALAFRLPGDLNSEAVAHIEQQKWKLLSLGKTGADLEKAETGGNDYRFPNPRFERIGFASKRVGLGLLGLECLLFAISWLFAHNHREEHWRTLLPAVLGVSVALALLMQVALPIQSYIANKSSFPFTLTALCGAVSVRFALLFVWDTLALFLLTYCFGRWILAPVFAFTVCAYLESGILATGQPSLNGDWTYFANWTQASWNAVVWGGVFLLVFALHHWLKKSYGVASLCLVAMLAASMLDVKPEQKADTSNLIVNDFSSIETVIRSVTYSSNRNVMVFVIDSLEREQAHAIMEDPEAGPDLREKFRGFTEYVDNVGTANISESGVANLFTGKYPETALGFPAYFVSVYSADSALYDFLRNDAAVYLGTSALGYGYTNRRRDVKETAPDQKWRIFNGNGKNWGMAETCRFRWIPFGAKWRYAHIVELGKMQNSGFTKEWVAYSWLQNATVHSDEKLTFLFLHTDGVHVPIQRDRNGNYLVTPDDTDNGTIEMGVYIFSELGRLFDSYREKGIYDKSMIVVLADHGNHVHGPSSDARDLPGIARPFLWVKPIGSHNGFATSHLPTSHARVAALLKESSRNDLNESEIQDILQMENRLFRIAFGSGSRRDWWVRRDGRVHMEEGVLSGGASYKIQPVLLEHVYSFDLRRSSAGELENILLSKFFLRFFPRWFADTQDVGIAFKVPDARERYDVRIKLVPWLWEVAETADNVPGACFRFRQEGRNGEWEEGRTGDAVEITLRGLVPDDLGMIRLVGERDKGIRSVSRLVEMEVSIHE